MHGVIARLGQQGELAGEIEAVRDAHLILAGEIEDHRHIVRAKAPERVLVRPQLPEIEPVRIDVVDVA